MVLAGYVAETEGDQHGLCGMPLIGKDHMFVFIFKYTHDLLIAISSHFEFHSVGYS